MENVINFDLLKEYDGTLKEVLKVWQKEKLYSVDDTIQYKGKYLKCITAGTSGTTTLNFTGLDVGDTITDGTVVWEIIELGDSYSTEEKRIGTWIDGKSLYRKVFTPTGSGNIRYFSSGLDSTNYNIIKLYGDIDEGNIIVPLPYHDADITFSIYYNKSNGDIYVTSNLSSYTIQYVAVEYTKN